MDLESIKPDQTLVADFILMPCRPARFDLKAIGSTAAIAKLSMFVRRQSHPVDPNSLAYGLPLLRGQAVFL